MRFPYVKQWRQVTQWQEVTATAEWAGFVNDALLAEGISQDAAMLCQFDHNWSYFYVSHQMALAFLGWQRVSSWQQTNFGGGGGVSKTWWSTVASVAQQQICLLYLNIIDRLLRFLMPFTNAFCGMFYRIDVGKILWKISHSGYDEKKWQNDIWHISNIYFCRKNSALTVFLINLDATQLDKL